MKKYILCKVKFVATSSMKLLNHTDACCGRGEQRNDWRAVLLLTGLASSPSGDFEILVELNDHIIIVFV